MEEKGEWRDTSTAIAGMYSPSQRDRLPVHTPLPAAAASVPYPFAHVEFIYTYLLSCGCEQFIAVEFCLPCWTQVLYNIVFNSTAYIALSAYPITRKEGEEVKKEGLAKKRRETNLNPYPPPPTLVTPPRTRC